MKRIYQDGKPDYSDEGSQSLAMLNRAELVNFIKKLNPRQQRILALKSSGEEIKDIARFLGLSVITIKRELKSIKAGWKKYK